MKWTVTNDESGGFVRVTTGGLSRPLWEAGLSTLFDHTGARLRVFEDAEGAEARLSR